MPRMKKTTPRVKNMAPPTRTERIVIELGPNFKKQMHQFCLERDIFMRDFLLKMAKRAMENKGWEVGSYEE